MGIESNTIVVSWGQPVVGRETQAGELFAASIASFERFKKAGKIESWEPVLLAPYGGDLAGFFVVRGTHDNLRNLLVETEFQENNMRAMHCLTKFAVLTAYNGKSCQDLLGLWAKALPR